MSDQRPPDPRHVDPNYPGVRPDSPYGDPVNDPRFGGPPVGSGGGRGGLIAAGVIAVLLVIALIAFSSGPGTDPGTTAVIPDQSGETTPAPVTPVE